jgi:cell division transport system permease protein
MSMVRNGVVTATALFIMTVTLFLIGLLLFTQGLLEGTLADIKDKVDVNVYFATTAGETDIVALKQRLESLPEVAYVEYTTRDEALERFRERHVNDQLTLQALDELGDNPLGASLAIKAKEPSQYESIATFLGGEPVLGAGGVQIIDRVNYFQNKAVIDRLSKIIDATRAVGLGVVLIFVLVSILIAFNTLRLVIYTSREEISVMRLVGASNMYVRGPFIVAGILYGVLAAIITLLLFVPLTTYVGPYTESWFGNVNLATYYRDHFFFIVFVIFGSGVLLGGISSWLAVQRYLKT